MKQLNLLNNKNNINTIDDMGLIKTNIGYSFKLKQDNDLYSFMIINKKISYIKYIGYGDDFITPGRMKILKKRGNIILKEYLKQGKIT